MMNATLNTIMSTQTKTFKPLEIESEDYFH